MIRRFFTVTILLALLTSRLATAAEFPDMKLGDFDDVASKHPAGDALKRLFPTDAKPPTDFKATGLTKKDYLPLIAGNIDFWKQHQNDAGAIIDPYENAERQYSTPAFASAAALLVKEAGRKDLLEPASRAFDFSLTALQNGTTANRHPDFYIPMLVHAYRILRDVAPREQVAKWEGQFKSLVPKDVYNDTTAGANWNVVNVSGEALRRKSGLVADDQKAAQQEYLDAMLAKQQRRFTKYGLYADPNVPLAYDAFPRLWLEEMVADDAYTGPQREQLERFLITGGLSSLLMLSPQGEWPSGGRSAQHQWNEAENAVIAEINANKWKKAGRADVAGAFKRSARLGLKSMQRWKRPSGEMWIVKNRAEPADRLGFEGYSFHSQYNLLPMAMLAIAYTRADDSIEERPIPSETGQYVFEIGEPFTFVIAAAGGNYVLANTSADYHYDATGLQRVHRAGVELSPLSGSSGRAGLAPGLQWKDGDEWVAAGEFHRPEPPPRVRPGEPAPKVEPQRTVKKADVDVKKPGGDGGVAFTVTYQLDGPSARAVTETYTIPANDDHIELSQLVSNAADPTRAVFPVLVSNGATDTNVKLDGPTIMVTRDGGSLVVKLLDPPGVIPFTLEGDRIRAHNGYLQTAVADLPAGTKQLRWAIRVAPAPAK